MRFGNFSCQDAKRGRFLLFLRAFAPLREMFRDSVAALPRWVSVVKFSFLRELGVSAVEFSELGNGGNW